MAAALEIVHQYEGDTEAAHIELDDLAMKLLRSEGYDDFVAVFKAAAKWYS